ncbi:MAG: hypothetical protein A2Y10_03360 [Planctomycetes bacterium GWF2_41_51]|nr:MAG: hypothetical protein A2Y10_03360 [Planctomycetes bacterium GWF2_41_51]HBG28298.1 hypothetical protein [Phycisphaerales bacterium]
MNTKITVIAAIVLLMSVQVHATTIYGTVTMDYTGFGASDSMTVWGGGLNGQSVTVGALTFNKTNGTGDGQYLDNGSIGVFCIDLLEYVGSGTKTYDVIMPQDGPRPTSFLGGGMGQAKADYLSELWGRYYDSAWTSGGTYTTQQKKNAEAFAAAVWEIVYEDVPSAPMYWDVTVDSTLGGKGFKASNLDYQTANSWLRSLNGTGPMADLRALSNLGSQDFIVAMNIPEPATIALAVLGLFLVSKRRIAK